MRVRTLIIAALAALLSAAIVANAQVNSTLQSVITYSGDNSTFKPTFSASAYVLVAASPTDICTLTGSATRTIRIRRVILGGIATAVSSFPIALVKRSAANTGGSIAAGTEVGYDSQLGTASAVAVSYTANPAALGTSVGVLADPMVTFNNATTGISGGSFTEYKFGELGGPVVLRGTGQVFAVNGNAVTITGGLLSCTIEWTEDTQ